MPNAADTARSPGSRGTRGRRRVRTLAWAATVCALGGVLATGAVLRRPASPVSDLVAAVGQVRTVEARVTGGFLYADLNYPTRGGQSSGAGWRVLAAAARLEDAVNVAPTPENLHVLGIAALQAQHYDDAVLALEDALSGDADNAAYLSDLSAAYLARSQGGPAIDVTRALTPASRAARIDPRSPEAQFNRALALGRLFLRHEETLAWDAYLQSFGAEAGWADEARRRRDEADAEVAPIAPSPAARAEQLLDEWADVAAKAPADAFLPPLLSPDPFYADLGAALVAARGDAARALARSVQDLRAADAAVTRAEYTTADVRASQALSRSGSITPIALWARRHQITAAFYAGRAADGRREAERLLPELQARGYRALESDLHLRIAGFDYSAGSYDAALAGYERATAIRESIGDGKGAASARLAAAEALRALGDCPRPGSTTRVSWPSARLAIPAWNSFAS